MQGERLSEWELMGTIGTRSEHKSAALRNTDASRAWGACALRRFNMEVKLDISTIRDRPSKFHLLQLDLRLVLPLPADPNYGIDESGFGPTNPRT